MFPLYPKSTPLTLGHRPVLHPLFRQLRDNISEFTFANLYLFRQRHQYRLSSLGPPVILGSDDGTPFFMLPFGLPEPADLKRLFADHGTLKCASSAQAALLEAQGYRVSEDRDNFDYLYRRQDLVRLSGRNYHKKRNLIKAITSTHTLCARPLREEFRDDALRVLETWRQGSPEIGDYEAAREALEMMEPLQLCGGIYSIGPEPVAYVLGEELGDATCFVIHFEKAVAGYKGLYQFINQSFASILPESYQTINREQDLGDAGLRQAKLSYLPAGFVQKFKVTAPESIPPAH